MSHPGANIGVGIITPKSYSNLPTTARTALNPQHCVRRSKSMRQLICTAALITILLGPFTQLAYSQADADERFDQVTKRIDELESRI